MKTASVILFASVVVFVAAESKIELKAAEKEGSTDRTPGQVRQSPNDGDSGASQPLLSHTSDAGEETSAATFLQPQFVVPDNGDPVGLRVRPSSISSRSSGGSGDPVRAAGRREDRPAASPASLTPPPAAARADSYGLLSGPEVAERDAGVNRSPVSPRLPPVAQRRSDGPPLLPAPTNTGPGGGDGTQGRLLSLIDGVYQQSLDTDANTTFITPLDRLGREPFELSVSRYSRFVEDQAKRRGKTHAEEDLEDLLQRLKGRLNLEKPDKGQVEERSEVSDGVTPGVPAATRTAGLVIDLVSGEDIPLGRAVDPEPSIFLDAKAGGDAVDARLSREKDGQLHAAGDKKNPPRHKGETSADHHQHVGYGHRPKVAYENKPAESFKGIKRIIFGELGNKKTADRNDSTKNVKKESDSRSPSPIRQNEKLAKIFPQQAVSDSVPSDDFLFSKVKPCQGDCEPSNKAPDQRPIRPERDPHTHTAENGKPGRRINEEVAELPDNLQPPSPSQSQPEVRNSLTSTITANDDADKYDDSASTLSVDLGAGKKYFKPYSPSPITKTEKPRRLSEYETHAEISLRGGIEASDPEAEGYGPAKPSSIYKPGEASASENTTSAEKGEADKGPERAVTPRSFDAEESSSPSSESSKKRAEPRLIEPWETPKQQPRIKIHLPFVQKETVVQFHPRDRHRYGPPKGIHSTSVKTQTISDHPQKHREVAGTTERPLPSRLRPPSRAPADGHAAAGSSLPSHLLPKEHRIKVQSHGQPQTHHDKRPGTGTGYQPPVPASPAAEYHQPIHQEPVAEYPSQSPSHPQHDYGAPVQLAPPAHLPPAYRRPTSARPKPSLRPAWLDVPHEVLPLGAPPGTATELPYDPAAELAFDPVKLTTPSPAYFPPGPDYPPLQPHRGASSGGKGGKLSSHFQLTSFPAPHESTHSLPVGNYVSPLPVRLTSTTPSSYVSLHSSPSHASPKPTPSYTPPKPTPSYAPPKPAPSYTPPKPAPSYTPPKPAPSYTPPKPAPSYTPTKPTPSYTPPKPAPSYTSPKPTPSYAPPTSNPSHSSPKPVQAYASPRPTPSYPPPKPTPAYVRPHPSPSHAAPAHPVPEPQLVRLPQAGVNQPLPGHLIPQTPAVLPPPAIRNYAVPSVDKLAERPQARVPVGSHVRDFVEPPHEHLRHIPSPPEIHLPPPEHPVRNYVTSPEDKLVQKSKTPVAHVSDAALDNQPIRNYVPPPEHELAQKPHVPVAHSLRPVSIGQPVRNYAASSEDHPIKNPQLLLALPAHQAPAGHITRNYRPPALGRDGADRRTAQEHMITHDTAVEPPQHSANNHSADEARPGPSIRPEDLEQRGKADGAHRIQEPPPSPPQQQQSHSSSQQLQLPGATSSDGHRLQKPQEVTSIIDVLEAADAKLLLKLMELSGMRQLLEDTGPYTLFAPSEQALKDLLHRLGGLDTILDSMGKESLLKLLQYHVLRGYALREDLDHELLAKTLEGSRLRINRYDTYDNLYGRANVTTVNGERLTQADLTADNGLVHFIDGVLAPPPVDLMQALRRDPRGRFTVLTEAVKLAGLQNVLTDRAGGPLTLLAPTNVAFTQLPADQLRRLLRDRRRLRQLLLGHVIPGTVYSAGLQPFQERHTLADSTVRVFSDTVSMKVDNALVLVPDVTAGNGVVHAIDAVLGLQEER